MTSIHMKTSIRVLTAALMLSTALSLSACKTTEDPVVGKAANSMSGMNRQTVDRLTTAASDAIAQGRADEAVDQYAALYKKDSKNPETALNYAQLLRKTGKPADASKILSAFVDDKKTPDPVFINEYAAAEIALGHGSKAEKLLNLVLENEKAEEHHADAYNLMGIVLDARGEHKEAEQMFRLAMEGWRGNPTSVMNNLALCLATQGMFDESLLTLRKALVMAPDKQEIARNIQIVSDLRDSIVPAAPVNIKKK